MYTSHFGFTEKPFKLKPDAEYLFNSTYGQKCYAELVRGVLDGSGTIILTGEVGCGKTTLVEKCCAKLADVVHFVRVSNSHLSADDILHLLAEEFDIADQHQQPDIWRQQLREGLIAQRQQQGGGVVLVVDDAHGLNEDCLETLLDFAAEPLAGQRVLQLLLVGSLDLANRCQSHDSKLIFCQLEGLSSSEIGSYIQHQLKLAGYRGEPLFTTDAVRAVVVHAGGLPRRINALCDAALFTASLDGRRTITSQQVVDAVEHSFLKDSAPVTLASTPDSELLAGEQSDASQSVAGSQDAMNLTALAADMQETLEQALAVAGAGAPAAAQKREKPQQAVNDRIKTGKPPRSKPQRVAEPQPVATASELSPGQKATPRIALLRRPAVLAGVVGILVCGIVLGAWQWRQQPGLSTGSEQRQQASVESLAPTDRAMPSADQPAPPASPLADSDVVSSVTSAVEVLPVQPRSDHLTISDEVSLAANATSAPSQDRRVPHSLDLPLPTRSAPPAPRGLPPLDPNNPFAARPFQATHQFLDANGVEFRREDE